MNQRKVKLQKTLGILNLISGIFQVLEGVLLISASSWLTELIKSAPEENAVLEILSILGELFYVFAIFTGIIAIGMGILFIVFAAKLIKEPQMLPDGSINERKGIVIFFLVMSSISAFDSLTMLLSGMLPILPALAFYVAGIVVASLSLKEHHYFPDRQPNNQGSFDSWGN